MSYLLAEKGGEEFLSTAVDCIDEIAVANKKQAVPEEEPAAQPIQENLSVLEDAEDKGEQQNSHTEHAEYDNILAEETVQIDGIIDGDEYYELDGENKGFFGFLNKFKRFRKI
jgi:hypothetical protein